MIASIMIEAYTALTPNGRKLAIMLEETGLAYEARLLDIAKGEPHAAWFRRLNPNGKIPVIRDTDTGRVVWESGPTLIYLAEKAGRLLPADPAARLDVLQWLFFQAGSLGPMSGQFNHFRLREGEPHALARYRSEVLRLLGVLDGALQERTYIGGAYSIADIALLPWIRAVQKWGLALDDFTHLERWYAHLTERPVVRRGFEVPTSSRPRETPTSRAQA
ncbi:glutathione S-transferase N-terminal domain-containing protein [Salinisphaera sp. T31B1]|uniref:glutathione S-transferase family protein n=1 Tax=Salinisphaera sp. T31B1 TaxID=727963 RepID=UPI003340CD8D